VFRKGKSMEVLYMYNILIKVNSLKNFLFFFFHIICTDVYLSIYPDRYIIMLWLRARHYSVNKFLTLLNVCY